MYNSDGTFASPGYGINSYLNKNSGDGPLKTKVGATPGLTGYLSAGADVLQGLGALGNAYVGWENLGLAKDKFKIEKAAINRNIENQAKLANNAYDNASAVGLALGGGAMTPEQIAAERSAVKDRYLNSSKIG